MKFIETYGKEIVAIAVPFVIWLMNRIFSGRAKLLLGRPHEFMFLVQQPLFDESGNQISPTQTVHTRSFIVKNTGKDSATRIEWLFNWKPQVLNLWPPRHFSESVESDQRCVLTIDSLAPNEFVLCEILSINMNLPELLTVRSDQCVAKNITMYPQPVLPTWQRRIVVSLLFFGLAAVIYIVIWILQFLVLKTPFGP